MGWVDTEIWTKWLRHKVALPPGRSAPDSICSKQVCRALRRLAESIGTKPHSLSSHHKKSWIGSCSVSSWQRAASEIDGKVAGWWTAGSKSFTMNLPRRHSTPQKMLHCTWFLRQVWAQLQQSNAWHQSLNHHVSLQVLHNHYIMDSFKPLIVFCHNGTLSNLYFNDIINVLSHQLVSASLSKITGEGLC